MDYEFDTSDETSSFDVGNPDLSEIELQDESDIYELVNEGIANPPEAVSDSNIDILMDESTNEPIDCTGALEKDIKTQELPIDIDYEDAESINFEELMDNETKIPEIDPVEHMDGNKKEVEEVDNLSSEDVVNNGLSGESDIEFSQMDIKNDSDQDVYTAPPIFDIPIIQEDSAVDSIENIMNQLNENGDISEETKQDFPSEAEDTVQDELTEITPLKDIDRWIKNVNPNFDEFDTESPYCNNCGSCAYAVYQRLEGNPEICVTTENIENVNEMATLTEMDQVSMTPQEIEERLLEEGDGAHAIIGIDRADEIPGHWFNAACIDGKVVAIDGQNGSISGWPPDFGDVVNWDMSIRKETNNG